MKSSKYRLYSNSSLYTGLFAGVAFSVAGLGTPDAFANPQGATVVSGQISVSQTGSSEIITQSTNSAIINWQSFNILSGESTRFIQPSSNSVALNRITSGSASEILGSLSANGHLIIVNPNGVFFGSGATVNVAGLIASTADISNANFTAGNYSFSSPGNPNATIVNKGVITAADGGLVALVAPSVQNSGVINATVGTVALGAAQTFTIDFYGDNLFSFSLGTPTTQANALVNSGLISAKGGNVYLTARAAGSVVNDVINNTGIIDASASYKTKAGTIVIDGGNGNVNIAGNLNASGKYTGQTGGSIAVTGNNVTIASGANLDASGNAGGGQVNINALDSLTDAAGSVINVSALVNGNGGSAVLYSANDTEFFGSILATGGVNGGNGGSVETSGGYVNPQGIVNAAALNASGLAGSWLLDPYSIIIEDSGTGTLNSNGNYTSNSSSSTISPTAIENELESGTNVTIKTGNGGTGTGYIELVDSIDVTGSDKAKLTFNAADYILLDANKTISAPNAALSVDLEAGTQITLSAGSSINTDGGKVTLNADDKGATAGGYIFLDSGSSITSGGGDITLGGGGANGAAVSGNASIGGVTLGEWNAGGATISASGGNINITGTAASTGGTEWDGVDVMGGSTISTTGNGTITINGYGSTATGSPNNSVGVFLNESSITSQNGDISITGTGEINGNIPSFGIALDNSTVATTGKGNITLTGTGSSGSDGIVSGFDNYGSATLGGSGDTGNITLNGNSIALLSGGITTTGAVTLTTTTTTGDVTLANETIKGGSVTIDPSSVTLTDTSIDATSGSAIIDANNNIVLNDSSITTAGGDIVLGGFFGILPSVSTIDGTAGITLNDASLTANGGNIRILGAGDASGTAGSNDGILVENGSTITTSGNGAITLVGLGGGAGSSGNNFGISLTGAGTAISAVNGDITLVGTGGNTSGDYDIGTSIQTGASVASNGSGNINITGFGGGTGASTDDVGTVVAALSINDGTGVFSNGTGNITLIGYTGDRNGNGVNTNYYDGGVYVNAPISSGDGNIVIDANTGLNSFLFPVSNTTGSGNFGITTYNATDISTTGTGTITLNGVAPLSSTGGNNIGVLLQNGAKVSTSGTDITINGTSGTGEYGVDIVNGTLGNSSVSAGGAGTVGITALNGSDIFSAGAISSDSGDITFTGQNITLSGGTVTSTSGAVTADAVNNITVSNNNITTGNSGTTGGTITLTADDAAANAGYVLVDDGSVVASNGGNITLSGASGDTSFGGVSIGNYHDGSSAQINAGGGTITITGTAATGTTEFDGVDVLNGSQITTTGTGTITLTGYGSTGDSTNSGGDSAGVWLYNGSSILAANGNISITGTAQGTTSGIPNYGIVFENGTVANDGTGAITITGTGANGADGVVSGNSYFGGSATIGGTGDTGTILVTGNSLSLLSGIITTSNAITLSATGDVTVANNTISGGSVTVDPTNVSFSNTSVNAATGAITYNASGDIVLNDTSLTTQGGNITLASNDGNTGAGAIVIQNGSSLTSNGGTITLGGGNAQGTGYAYGDSTAPVTPYGGEAGISIDNSLVNAGSGDIFAKGIGGNNSQNVGVEITGTGELETTSGGVTINGYGTDSTGYGAYGVVLGSGGSIQTGSGDISVTGTGAATCTPTGGCGYGNGVQLYNSSSITTNSGKITLTGTAGGPEVDGPTGNFGIYTVLGNNVIGGSSDTGAIKIIATSGSSIDLNNVTVNTAGKILVDPTDFTLDASSMTGKDITIDARDVTLLGDSTLNAGKGKHDALTINNTGVFYSDTTDVLNGYTITFNQNAGPNSSIQDAIDATGQYHTAKLTLGKGSWREDVSLDRSDFTLTGHGKDSVIKATGKNQTVLTIDGQHNDTVSDLAISSNGHKNVTGISVDPSNFITIASDTINVSGNGIDIHGGKYDTLVDNTITTHSGNDGVKLSSVSDTSVDGNTISGFKTGVDVNNGEYDTVKYNTITGTTDAAINVSGGRDITVARNTLKDVIGDGIDVSYSENDTIYDNKIEGASFWFYNLGNDGIKLYDVSETSVDGNTISHFDTGIDVKNAKFVSIKHNHISDSTVAGINVDGGRNITIARNTLNNIIGDGIDVEHSNNVSIFGNWIEAATFWFFNLGDNGITLSDVSDSKVDGNNISDFKTGIDVKDSKYDSVKYNHISGSTVAGINVEGGKGITIAFNGIKDAIGDGIDVAYSSDDGIYGNWIEGAKFWFFNLGDNGIKLSDVSDTFVGGNSISGFKTGIDVKDSKSDSIKFNRISGTTVAGISVDGGKDITIAFNSIKDAIGNGIVVADSRDDSIFGNWIEAASFWFFNLGDDGIKLSDDSDTTVDGNSISNFKTGIDVKDGRSDSVKYNRITGSTVAGISVDGGKDITVARNTIKDAVGYGIDVTDSHGDSIDDNKIEGSKKSKHNLDGIKLSDVSDTKVDGNTISGFKTGIDIVDNSRYVTVKGNKISGTTVAGINVDPSSHITIAWNTISDVIGDGINITGGSDDSIYGNTITADSFWFFSFGDDGIKLSDVSDSFVGGNTINDFKTGIDVKNGKSDAIVGNRIKGSTVAGINVDGGKDITVAFNSLKDVIGNGIDVTDSSKDAIFGNWIEGAKFWFFNLGDNGIKLSDVSDTSVDGNSISGFKTGIDVKDSKSDSIKYNRVYGSTDAGIKVDGGKDITIAYNSLKDIIGNGIDVKDSSGDSILGNWIEAASFWFGSLGNDGIKLSDVSNTKVDGNTISNFATGISVKDSKSITLKDDTITGATIAGIDIDASKDITISGDTIDTSGDGIDATDSSDLTILHNRIKGSGHGIGISFDDVTGTNKIGNDTKGGSNTIRGFATGIKLSDSTASIEMNKVSKDFVGISVDGGKNITIADNSIDTKSDGVDITDSKNDDITGNTITSKKGVGISVDPSHDITISGNTVTTTKGDGIDVSDTDGVTVSDNSITSTSGKGDGIDLSKDKGTVTVSNNTINNFGVGVNVFKTDNVQFASNTITGFNGSFVLDIATGAITQTGGSIGVKVTDSDNVSFSGDSFIGNVIGLDLIGSPNAKVEGASFTDNTVAFLAVDGKGKNYSSNEIVGDSTFDGDLLGVVLDGPHASMQFDVTQPPSHFNGEAFYFVLVNGAMDGEILDASQQYFNGNLAAEFSFGPFGELAQAEARTIDSHNNFGVGTVFYRFDPLALNDDNDNFFNQLEDLLLGKPQFSYAGQTFGHFVPSLDIQGVNLSLLASGGNVTFANLSPAAGGDTTPNGSNTVDLASLSPSAGGPGDCGNSFLGNGFAMGYNKGSCSK